MRIISKDAVDIIFVQESNDERWNPEGHRLWINFKEELPSSIFEKITEEEVNSSIERLKDSKRFGETEYRAEYKDSVLKVSYYFGDWFEGLVDASERAERNGDLVMFSDSFWHSLWKQAHERTECFMERLLQDILKDDYDRLNILSYDGNLYYKRCKLRGEL